ncbi:MotA/TolQ/ExbB proton channel family protein [Bradyrhizobium sp. AZCC 1708]|uniref:MotA/TolQ/ExbB proton channel family protein n=1 Tax=Bradyrhizobium sp. AZCC 1708 TaxID=3117015 RepID=UPI002FEFD0D1
MKMRRLCLLKPITFLGSEEMEVPLGVRISRTLILFIIGSLLTWAFYMILNGAAGYPFDYGPAVKTFNTAVEQLRKEIPGGERLPSVVAHIRAADGNYTVFVRIQESAEKVAPKEKCMVPAEYCMMDVAPYYLPSFLPRSWWPFISISYPVAVQPLLNAVEDTAKDQSAKLKPGESKPSDQILRQYREGLSGKVRTYLPHLSSFSLTQGGTNLPLLTKFHGIVQYSTVFVFFCLLWSLLVRWAYGFLPDSMIRDLDVFPMPQTNASTEAASGGVAPQKEFTEVELPWKRKEGTPAEIFTLYEHVEREITRLASPSKRVPLRSPFLELRKIAHAALMVGQNISQVPTFVQSKCDGMVQSRAASLGMVRYLIWAIPTLGFVGTVVGIGDAMVLTSELQDRSPILRAISQAGIGASIGIAFDTTLVALLLSLIAMFLFHMLQQQEEQDLLQTADETLVDLTTYPNLLPPVPIVAQVDADAAQRAHSEIMRTAEIMRQLREDSSLQRRPRSAIWSGLIAMLIVVVVLVVFASLAKG